MLEETHLYPFGSKMTAICSRALPGVQNSLSYQGKEMDEEFDLDLFDFEARYYDPQTGRFIQQDPADQFASGYTGMGNNWINGRDPNGEYAFFDDLGAMGIGAIVNVLGNIGNIHSPGDFFGYAIVGAASGEATLYGGPMAGGVVAGAGNAYLGGAKGWDIVQAGFIGGASSVLGGAAGSAIGGAIAGKASTVIGEKASTVVASIASSAIVGGGFGAGFSSMSGGNAWQGFVSGMRNGAISGTISSLVPAAINGMKKPKPSVPKEVEVETVDQTPNVKTELPPTPSNLPKNIVEPKWDKVRLNGTKTSQGTMPLPDFKTKLAEWNKVRVAHGQKPVNFPEGMESYRDYFHIEMGDGTTFKAEFYSGNNGTTIKTYFNNPAINRNAGLIKLRLD